MVFKKLLWGMFPLFMASALTACSEETEISSIQVDEDTVQREFFIEDFDRSDIELMVYYDDGTEERVPLSKEMVSEDDYDKLSTPGDHTIPVTYEGVSTDVELTLVDTGTIAFESLGGSAIEDMVADYGSEIETPPSPKKAGHTFKGWYVDEDYEEPFEFTTMPSEALTLYAKWEVSTYEIRFDSEGGNSLQTQRIDYGTTVEDLPEPVKTDYTFDGWLLDGEPIERPFDYDFEEDQTLVAQWETLSEGLAYEIMDDEVIIHDYTGSEEELIMPSTIAGHPVTTIAEAAFMDNDTLKDVVVSEHVTTIEDHAFSNMSALTSIEFPNATQTFGSEVLYETDNLETMTLSSEAENELKHYFGNTPTDIPDTLQTLQHATGGDFIDQALISADLKDVTLVLAEDLSRIDASTFKDNRHIQAIVLPEGLDTIGDDAFKDSTLRSIHIPGSVTTIGSDAFMEASNLTIFTDHENKPADWRDDWNASDRSVVWGYQETVDNGEVVYALGENETISILGLSDDALDVDLVIPSTIAGRTVDQIVNDAFEDEDELLSITIPNTLQTIQSETFRGAECLHTLTFEEGSRIIKSIGDRAFYDASNLAGITIPASVERIEDRAFFNTLSLTALDFEADSQLTFIGTTAFLRAQSLKSVTIPASVTTIKEAAFGDTSSLASVTFEEGSQLTHLSDQMFFDATKLKSIEIPASVTHIKEGAFSGAALTSLTLPENSRLQTIEAFAFAYADTLKSIHIPAGVTSIGASAFGYTDALETVTFEEGSKLKSIGEYAFKNAVSLTSIVIPESAESIGSNAFINADSLTIYTEATEKPEGWHSEWNHGSRPVEWGSTDYGIYNDLDYAVRPDDTVIILGQTATSEATSIDIPQTVDGLDVTTIGARAFKSDSELEDVFIPSSLTTIDRLAFEDADLSTIYAEAEGKPEGWDADWNPYGITVEWGHVKE